MQGSTQEQADLAMSGTATGLPSSGVGVPVSELSNSQAGSVVVTTTKSDKSRETLKHEFREQLRKQCRPEIEEGLDSFLENFIKLAEAEAMKMALRDMNSQLAAGSASAASAPVAALAPPTNELPAGRLSSPLGSVDLGLVTDDDAQHQAALQKRQQEQQAAALFDMPERHNIANVPPTAKFDLLCLAASDQRSNKERTKAFVLFRKRIAIPFRRCFETCFGGDKERFMIAWRLDDYAFDRWRDKCVVGTKCRAPWCYLLQRESEVKEAAR